MRPYIVQGCAAGHVGLETRETECRVERKNTKIPVFIVVFGSSGGKNAKIAAFIVVCGVHRGGLCRREKNRDKHFFCNRDGTPSKKFAVRQGVF